VDEMETGTGRPVPVSKQLPGRPGRAAYFRWQRVHITALLTRRNG
jgi:hypothetical protein